MSSSLVSRILRSRATQRSEPMLLHVLRALNWHTERGSTCDPLPLGHAEILRQHNLLIPQFMDRSTQSRSWFRGTLTHKITEMSPSRQRLQRRHHWLCLQHFGGMLPELLLSFVLNWSNHWGTWSLDRSARSTSMICHSS